MCTTCGCGHTHQAHPNSYPEKTRSVRVEEDILARNNADAALLRTFFRQHRILTLNLVSSPGSGKTELLAATVRHPLMAEVPLAVIEGDLATDNDARRIEAAGAHAVQINTGRGCHLEAQQILTALPKLNPADRSVLFIENVGNLVCPAEFDLGEAHKVALISVTEGDDKPLKYPGVFQVSEAVILNKVDTMPVFNFNQEAFEESVNQLNPQAPIFPLSATTGEGLEAWTSWLAERIRKA